MNPKTYNRVTSACVVVAILSAYTFDNFPAYRIPAIFLAVITSLTSIYTYFYNLEQENLKRFWQELPQLVRETIEEYETKK